MASILLYIHNVRQKTWDSFRIKNFSLILFGKIYPTICTIKFHMKKICILLTLLISIISIQSNSQSVILGNGTAISVFSPLNRTNDYCVYEVIYLSSQINLSGNITNLGFQRHDGTNTDSIENVSIYLKHTVQSQLAAGNYDTSGYTLVFTGSFPNDIGAGWREVTLDSVFNYNGVDNLQVLVSKGYQAAIANTPVTPRWIYTNINPSPARADRKSTRLNSSHSQ